jgi:hypothetical protein
MKKQFHLSIPKPCHEKWSSFAKTTSGGFCGSCQKEVIDFTSWSEERIQSYFKSLPQNACGRFRPEQLKSYALSQRSPRWHSWWAMVIAGVITLFTSRQVVAQTKPVATTEQYQPADAKVGEVSVKRSEVIRVTGVVKSAEDGSTLPGVNVDYKNTTSGTVTDADGAFTITIEEPTGHDTLVFSFIGLKPVKYGLDPYQPIQSISIAMELNLTELGETVVIAGGVIATRWYSPRRWWWGIKGLLRR